MKTTTSQKNVRNCVLINFVIKCLITNFLQYLYQLTQLGEREAIFILNFQFYLCERRHVERDMYMRTII